MTTISHWMIDLKIRRRTLKSVGEFHDTIKIMRSMFHRVIKKIHSSPKIMDALEKNQQDAER